MPKESPYITINDREYLPKEEYEKSEKKRERSKNNIFGAIHSVIPLGMAFVCISDLITDKTGLIEIVKNASLEELALWGGVFLCNSILGTSYLSKSFKLKKELKQLDYTISSYSTNVIK